MQRIESNNVIERIIQGNRGFDMQSFDMIEAPVATCSIVLRKVCANKIHPYICQRVKHDKNLTN